MDQWYEQLRDARHALGLSQAGAAQGITDLVTLAQIECGQIQPAQELVRLLSDRVRISTDPHTPIHDDRHRSAVEIESAMRRGDWETTRHLLTSLPSGHIAYSVYSAFVLERQGDYSGAIELLQDTSSSGSPMWTARRLLALCRCHRDSGDLLASVRAGEEALAQLHGFQIDDEIEMEIRSTLAGTYCETGELLRALDLTELTSAARPQAPWSSVSRLWARAMALQALGRFQEAQACAQESLLHLQTLGRPAATARLQNVAAWIAMQIPDFDADAVADSLHASERVFRELDAPVELALVLTSQAELSARTNQHPQARAHIEEAVSLMASQEAGERARITAAAAQIYASMGDREASMTHLLVARALLEDSGAKRSAAATWNEMAATYGALGQTDLQIVCLRAAMDLLDL